MAKQIKLGQQVMDSLTGFNGLTMGKCEYLNGCVSFLVQPPLKDGAWVEAKWFDEQQLNPESEVKGGGPQSRPPAMHP